MAVSVFLPASEEDREELLQDLEASPFCHAAFAGEVDCGEEGLSHRLAGGWRGKPCFSGTILFDGTGWRKPWMPYPKRKR
ncbi:MAG: hypothetical protein ACLR0F_02840 [Eisenbergiella sp.]